MPDAVQDVPLTVIGGRGPHGLALHLWMHDRGLGGYRLLDPAPHFLPLYGPDGPMQAVGHLRSPRELDFSLGDERRAMQSFTDSSGGKPLEHVYSLSDTHARDFNESTTPALRAPRLAFWEYANCLARFTNADDKVLHGKAERLEPVGEGWRVHLQDGRSFCTGAVLLATGLAPHLKVPQLWRPWWEALPQGARAHTLAYGYPAEGLKGKRVAVLGSSNLSTWEAAIRAAQLGAKVTLLSRAANPIEWQLPFSAQYFSADYIGRFMNLPDHKRLQILKKTHIPNSSVPGMAAEAARLGVRVRYHAKVQYATELWGGVQLQYRLPDEERAEYYDLLLAATGVAARLKDMPLMTEAAKEYKAPVITEGPARGRPILATDGRWKNLPPLYPLGAHAMGRAGFAANTLASATVYLPMILPQMLETAGIQAA